MKPTEELRHEHEVILHMLSGAEKLAASIASTHSLDSEKLKDIIDFSRHFTDGCHHAKEEKYLFVKLQEHGMSSTQGPIAVMLHEHAVGRSLIRAMDTASAEYGSGDAQAFETIRSTLRQYVELLRAHIAKENMVLFPMADLRLTETEQDILEESFKKVEEQEIGAGVHEKYHRMAHEIGG